MKKSTVSHHLSHDGNEAIRFEFSSHFDLDGVVLFRMFKVFAGELEVDLFNANHVQVLGELRRIVKLLEFGIGVNTSTGDFADNRHSSTAGVELD